MDENKIKIFLLFCLLVFIILLNGKYHNCYYPCYRNEVLYYRLHYRNEVPYYRPYYRNEVPFYETEDLYYQKYTYPSKRHRVMSYRREENLKAWDNFFSH